MPDSTASLRSTWRRPIAGSAAAPLLLAILVLAPAAGGRAAEQAAPASAPADKAAVAPAAPGPEATGTPATVIDDKQIESVLGTQVRSPTGEDMGRLIDVLVDKSGQLRAAVIDFGGFFGVGSRKIAVDWRSLHFNKDGKTNAIVVDLPRNQLRVSPMYKEGEPVVVLGRATAATNASAPATASPAAGQAPAK